MLEAVKSAKSRCELIYPILFGPKDEEAGTFGDLFQEGTLEALSGKVPTETLDRAAVLLHTHGIIELPGNFATRSVREIVAEMTQFLSFSAWQVAEPSKLPAEAVGAALDVLGDCMSSSSSAPTTATGIWLMKDNERERTTLLAERYSSTCAAGYKLRAFLEGKGLKKFATAIIEASDADCIDDFKLLDYLMVEELVRECGLKHVSAEKFRRLVIELRTESADTETYS
mmetsp:Transcript_24135/g.32998  ORF Transcript_24135/g.32998 Transcript_24135/m.32998 type:complete len:228 (-) Transcript_24135:436-1119(-)